MSSDVPYTTEACCQIPVVQSTYQPQGEIIKMGKYDDVYVVGNKDSTTSVINVFDIFGFFPQTQQGADILAETLGARVYMPDFFFGKPYPLAEHPPKNDEQKVATISYPLESGCSNDFIEKFLGLLCNDCRSRQCPPRLARVCQSTSERWYFKTLRLWLLLGWKDCNTLWMPDQGGLVPATL
ncbi:hypothetical protein FRB91_008348 [Serendipita sp. 411]|nr:hypothetical protein FRB91_008348 [Serendipita sp. 411]